MSRARRVFTILVAIFALLEVARWPGSALRPLELEPVASPLPEETPERDGILDVVVESDDGEGAAQAARAPLAGARVRAFAVIDGRVYAAGSATTDEGGGATLRDLPHAEHWIVADGDGRARASQMVSIEGGARRLDLVLRPEHHLEVEVKADDGAPIPFAELEIRASDPFPVGGRTGADGRARVGRLGEGPFTVTVRALGFEEVTRRRVSEGAPCVVTLGRQGALRVTVVDAAGAAVPGARVLVSSPSLWPARSSSTDEHGEVRIGGLDPGSYSLRAVHHARVSPIEVAVPVARGEERAIELRLGAGRMIAVRVVSADADDPVARAEVTLVEGGLSSFPIEGLTDKAGRVTLGPIAGGAATLSARAAGFVVHGGMAVPDGQDAAGEVLLRLTRGGALVGRVVDARGFPIDGATIRVIGTDASGMPIDEEPQRAAFRQAHFAVSLGGPRPLVPAGELGVMPGPVPPIPRQLSPSAASLSGASAPPSADPWVSARDGTFRAAPVPPGRVRALVRHPQYVEALSEVVTLAAEGEASVKVVLSRGGTLEGRVVDARGRPVARALVTVLALRGSLERTTRTATDGTFELAALPESVAVLVSREGEDLAQTAARIEVDVPDAGKKAVEIALPEPRPPLPVRVLTDRGAPVSAAQVSAISLEHGEAMRATVFTDARGEAELPSGKGLSLRVEARAPGRASKVLVTSAGTASLTFELAAAESLTGEVRANRREAVAGAEVTLFTEAGPRRARTDAEGMFTIRDLSPGRGRLLVRAPGRASATREVTVEERRGERPTAVPRIELSEGGTVEGRVVDARGNPIAGARVAEGAVPTYLPVGRSAAGVAVTNARGEFSLGELPEGNVTLEAYVPDVGRGRATSVRVLAGRRTDGVRIVVVHEPGKPAEPEAAGGVAVTLGETSAGLEAAEVVVVAVAEGSEAERAGLVPGDRVLEVSGAPVSTIEAARARLAGPLQEDVIVKVRRGDRVTTLRVSREPVRR